MTDMTFLTQFLTPEVEAFLFGAANFVATWIGSKVHKDAGKVFAVMTPFIAIIYITATFDWSKPIAPQLGGKLLIVASSSTGIWKWWRDWSGKTAQAKQALIEHGKDLANAENQGTVTIIPVQSDSPVTVGESVQVQNSQASPVVVQIPQDSSEVVVGDDTLQSKSPSVEQ